jgi:hypothetical protein
MPVRVAGLSDGWISSQPEVLARPGWVRNRDWELTQVSRWITREPES